MLAGSSYLKVKVLGSVLRYLDQRFKTLRKLDLNPNLEIVVGKTRFSLELNSPRMFFDEPGTGVTKNVGQCK